MKLRRRGRVTVPVRHLFLAITALCGSADANQMRGDVNPVELCGSLNLSTATSVGCFTILASRIAAISGPISLPFQALHQPGKTGTDSTRPLLGYLLLTSYIAVGEFSSWASDLGYCGKCHGFVRTSVLRALNRSCCSSQSFGVSAAQVMFLTPHDGGW